MNAMNSDFKISVKDVLCVLLKICLHLYSDNRIGTCHKKYNYVTDEKE